jgi:hypothetical protein
MIDWVGGWQSENTALLDTTSRAYFCQNVALLRLNAAWDCARALNVRPLWLALSGKAMEVLNVAMALKVYRYECVSGTPPAHHASSRPHTRAHTRTHASQLPFTLLSWSSLPSLLTHRLPCTRKVRVYACVCVRVD